LRLQMDPGSGHDSGDYTKSGREEKKNRSETSGADSKDSSSDNLE
jgi:hypothetical protein